MSNLALTKAWSAAIIIILFIKIAVDKTEGIVFETSTITQVCRVFLTFCRDV